MVAGHVREKKGYFYAVLNYTDVFGNRKTKWIATGLPVKGNKKRAEAILQEQRRKFVQDAPPADDMLFADFMEQWLEVVKTSIAVPIYASYCNMVKKIISPYFREKGITLKGLTAKDIQDFYLKELERVSAASVIHYHSNIHKALKYAVKLDLIPGNPADKVERPKKEKFSASFYDADEINKLFEISKGTKLEIPILLGAFYGLRCSEAIGLKWDAVDFEHDTITIKHTVTSVNLDGKHILVLQDTTKTKSSRRTLPLWKSWVSRTLRSAGQGVALDTRDASHPGPPFWKRWTKTFALFSTALYEIGRPEGADGGSPSVQPRNDRLERGVVVVLGALLDFEAVVLVAVFENERLLVREPDIQLHELLPVDVAVAEVHAVGGVDLAVLAVEVADVVLQVVEHALLVGVREEVRRVEHRAEADMALLLQLLDQRFQPPGRGDDVEDARLEREVHAAFLRLEADRADRGLDVFVVGLVGVAVDPAAAGREAAFAREVGDPGFGGEFNVAAGVIDDGGATVGVGIAQVGEDAEGSDGDPAAGEFAGSLLHACRGDPLEGADPVIGPAGELGVDEAELGAAEASRRHALRGVGNRQAVERPGRDPEIEHITTSF